MPGLSVTAAMNEMADEAIRNKPAERDAGQVGSSRLGLNQRFYPEIAVAGFSHVDGSIAFYSQIAALLQPHHKVLDYGAGRGEQIEDDPVPYRRNLVNLQGRCAHVAGCDVSPAVMDNPYLDDARIIDPAKPLPYADGTFDMIVSRYVFEHIDDPAMASSELLRVLKPGGWICAVTPNGVGYVALAARAVPNRLHVAALKKVQPGRKAEDVFPTRYRLNSKSALQRYFGRYADIYCFRSSSEPAYVFGSSFLFAAFKLLHKLLPEVLQTGLYIFIRKR